MGLYFRKVFKFGPARVSVSSRGVGFSIGGEKTRIGVDALGRPYAATEIAGVCLRSAAGGNCPAAKQKSAAAGSIAGHTQARLVPGPLPAQAVFSGSAGYGREAPANAGGIRFQGGGKTIYWRFSTARRVVFIVFGALVSTAGYFPLALLFAYTLARGSPSVPLGFAAAVLLLAGAGLFAAQSGVVIHDGSAQPTIFRLCQPPLMARRSGGLDAAVAAILSKARTAGGQRSLAAAARELDAELDTIPDSAAE